MKRLWRSFTTDHSTPWVFLSNRQGTCDPTRWVWVKNRGPSTFVMCFWEVGQIYLEKSRNIADIYTMWNCTPCRNMSAIFLMYFPSHVFPYTFTMWKTLKYTVVFHEHTRTSIYIVLWLCCFLWIQMLHKDAQRINISSQDILGQFCLKRYLDS